MKKCTLLFLFFSLAVSAQESFPYKRPFLILNKTVTVIRIPSSEQFGYYGFYEDPERKNIYKKVEVSTPEKELLGRSFTVTAIDSVKLLGEYNYILNLKSDAETIYYRFSPTSEGDHYSLEVKGGLELPEGFYCDFVEKGGLGLAAKVPEITLSKDDYTATKKDEFSLTFVFFDKFNVDDIKSVTLLLENNKTILAITNETWGSPHSGEYKYNFTILLKDNDVELLKANKLIGIKLQDNVHTFHPGSGVRLSGILKCMQGMPLPKH